MNEFDFISHNDALLKVERYTLDEGKSAGVHMVRVANSNGLEFHVAVERCLDITELRYRGIPISYYSGTGITHPAYYDSRGGEWLRSFFAGFLTTCGLDQVGDPSVFCGKEYGMHGRISNCPAEHISTDVLRENEKLCGHICGTVRQAMHQGEVILLRRKIIFNSEEAGFTLKDEITNLGCSKIPFMILYHFNFGYPFLNQNSKIKVPIFETSGWNEYSEKNKDQYAMFYHPFDHAKDLTLLHKTKSDDNGYVCVNICNNGVELKIIYNTNELPILGQWKHFKKNEYVMGIEPCNNHIKGVQWEFDNNTLEYLEPGDKKEISIRVEIQDER